MPEGFTANEWDSIANWIRAELQLRRDGRRHKEQMWKEIDRQLSMMPVQSAVTDQRTADPSNPVWYPKIELPLQFNALEVISADVRRFLFPRTGSWFNVSANLSDEYAQRWDSRRSAGLTLPDPQMNAFITAMGINAGKPAPLIGSEPVPVKLDQEVANVLPKAALEYFHRFYDFRKRICTFVTECLKYGEGVIRVRPVKANQYASRFKGSKSLTGPAVIPCSLWNTYLDDTWQATMHEGVLMSPSVIRCAWQPLESLKRAGASGGDGWLPDEIKKLTGKVGPDNRKEQVELVEFEGDVLVPMSDDTIFLPNVIITIAIGDGVKTVRFRENPMPFRSYVSHSYFQSDMKSAYGDSPLGKGMPIQKIATSIINDIAAVSRLNGIPPVSYDRNDPGFAGTGGPLIFPGAQWATDAANSIEVYKVGDVNALVTAYLASIKQYEDTVGVNDSRRGERLKSHTTAGAAQIEATQGLSRTDDFVTDLLAGPMATILHMEYEIVKQTMKKPLSISIGDEGIDGWINLAADDLADEVEFEVVGSEGAMEERQRLESFILATKSHVELAMAAAQLGTPVPTNFEAMVVELYDRANVTNANRYVGAASAISGGAAAESVIPGIAGVPGQEAGAAAPMEAMPPTGPVGPVNGAGSTIQ